MDIDERIANFDLNVRNTQRSRLAIEVRAKILDAYLITLNQELWVLKDFTRLEDKMVEAINDQVTARNEINQDLTVEKSAIEQHKVNIEEKQEQCKSLLHEFNSNSVGNKFFDFLRKIYKKKFRPVRVLDPDGQ